MARGKTPSLSWSESEQAWYSFVRFPDGSRRKVKRKDKDDAHADLNVLLAIRSSQTTAPKRETDLLTWNEVFDAWLAAGCPSGGIKPAGKGQTGRVKRKRGNSTQKQAERLLRVHVRPALGPLWHDRTTTERVEECFDQMATRIRGNAGKNATPDDVLSGSTIYHTWWHVANASAWAQRKRKVKQQPALDAQVPETADPRVRRSFSLAELETVVRGILLSSRPALWLTGLMTGIRPGELAGLRWCYLDLDSPVPILRVEERAHYDDDRYVEQRDPKKKSKRAIELHPLVVAVLQKQRDHLKSLGLYDDCAEPYAARGFVFPVEVARAGTAKRRPTRRGEPQTLGNIRKYLRELTESLDLGEDWTTYELRHSFTSLADHQLGDLQAVADVVGHLSTRTTLNYRHTVKDAVPHARLAFEGLLAEHGLTA